MAALMPKHARGDFLKRCIPELINEGKPQKQSVAICYSIYRKDGTEEKSPKPTQKSELAQLYCYMCDY